jgi:hypothetical protein
MSTNNAFRPQMIRKIVAQDSGADARAVAEEAVGAWEQIARVLAPIIGEGGFRALYARGLYLTRPKYPWLAATHGREQTDSPFSGLRVSLERRELTEAREASSALLVTFTELLATFIGEELTRRLLGSVRGYDGPRPSPETRK